MNPQFQLVKLPLVIILRGIPGSGKSSITNSIIKAFCPPCRFTKHSADDYFIRYNKKQQKKVYEFIPNRIGQAHKASLNGFQKAIYRKNLDLIIVDNTNIKQWEYQKYLSLSTPLNMKSLIVELTPKNSTDVLKCCQRCIHSVPEDVVKRMASTFEPCTDDINENQRVIKIAAPSTTNDGKKVVDFIRTFYFDDDHNGSQLQKKKMHERVVNNNNNNNNNNYNNNNYNNNVFKKTNATLSLSPGKLLFRNCIGIKEAKSKNNGFNNNKNNNTFNVLFSSEDDDDAEEEMEI